MTTLGDSWSSFASSADENRPMHRVAYLVVPPRTAPYRSVPLRTAPYRSVPFRTAPRLRWSCRCVSRAPRYGIPMDFAVAHLSSSCTAVVATRWAVRVAEYVRARVDVGTRASRVWPRSGGVGGGGSVVGNVGAWQRRELAVGAAVATSVVGRCRWWCGGRGGARGVVGYLDVIGDSWASVGRVDGGGWSWGRT